MPGFELSRLAVPQARVRRIIGTCYAIWEGTACRIWPQPAVAAMRLVKTLARRFARTRGERAAQASLPFRPEGQRNRMRVATAVSPFVGFEPSPRPAAQGRWEVRRSCGWLPLRFRRVCRTSRSPAVGCRLPNSQNNCGNSGTAALAAQSLFSQRLYAFSPVAPKGNPRAARFLGRRFRTGVRPEHLWAGNRSVRALLADCRS